MKSIKKLKKYGTAIAGSALLVGATLTGAAAQSGSSGDLGDYPAPFVDEDGNIQSSIVVGDDAATADVVGAIDIAGSLSQAAFTAEEIEGGDTASEVDGESLDEEVIGNDISPTSIDASDATYFTRETVEDDDGDDVFVTESATVSADAAVTSRVNGSTTDLNVRKDSVHYSASFSPGMAVNDTINMLGEEFEVTNFESPTEVDLGSTEEASGLAVGDSYEHGPYTINVEGGNSDNGDILVNVMEDGDQVESGQLSQDETLDVDEDFDVTATTAFYDSGSQSWSIALESTYTDTTLEQGEDFPLDDNYVVDTLSTTQLGNNDVRHVTGVTLRNDFRSVEDPEDEDEVEYLDVGNSVEGPLDYFTVQNDGLTAEATTDVQFAEEQEVTFQDVNNQEWTVDFNSTTTGANVTEDDIVGLAGESKDNDGSANDFYAAEVTSMSNDMTDVTVEHNDFSKDFSLSDVSDSHKYSTTGGSHHLVDNDANVAYQTVSTGYGFSITVEWIDDDASGSANDFSDNVDSVHIYNGSYAEEASTGLGDARFTTQNGAEIYSGQPSDLDNVAGNGDLTDTSTPSNIESIIVDETTGVSDNGQADQIAVSYGTTDDAFSDVDAGQISSINIDGQDEYSDEEDGEDGLSKFGTTVDLESSSSAVLGYPDEQRYQQVAFGDVGASGDTSGDSAMSQSPTYGDSFPSTGALDTDENIGQVKENDNVIVVGGPAINDLTAELADENQTWSANEWQTGGHEGTSILQMVDGWNEEQSALVVAGHAAEDTRTAAEFLANYGDHSDALSGQDQVTISTETGNVVE